MTAGGTAYGSDRSDLASRLVARLAERGLTVATAESLTGGLVVADLVSVPGASAVVRGGVVAYAYDVKAEVLGVDAALLAARGAVNDEVARQLAEGARRVCRADVGLATTGVAGPDPADGEPVGTVYVAVADASGCRAWRLTLAGDRAAIRAASVQAVLARALEGLG